MYGNSGSRKIRSVSACVRERNKTGTEQGKSWRPASRNEANLTFGFVPCTNLYPRHAIAVPLYHPSAIAHLCKLQFDRAHRFFQSSIPRLFPLSRDQILIGMFRSSDQSPKANSKIKCKICVNTDLRNVINRDKRKTW